MKGVRIGVVYAFLGGALIAMLFSAAQRLERNSYLDPDRYYHFAISREMVESEKLFLRQLPQVEGLGWDTYFVEKEFLFHQLTALAYRAGGEAGVQIAVWLAALLGIMAFYAYAARKVPPIYAFFSAVLFFGSPMLLNRMIMLRPHVVAITCFIFFMISLLGRRPFFLLLSTMAFVLSYHAFYLPLLALLAAGAADVFIHGRLGESDQRLYLSGILGLVAGLLLSPYFPSNIVSGLQIALIPSLMSGELSGIGFGMELYPTQSNFFLLGLFLPLSVFAAAIWRVGLERHGGKYNFSILFLLLVSGIFLWMSFQSRRGTEYFIPVCAFLFVELLIVTAPWKSRKISATVLVLMAAYFGWNAYWFSKEARLERGDAPQQALASMSALPWEGNYRVFNCEWETTPYLFYGRPNLRFLDILDPSLLYLKNPKAHLAREKLKASEVPDAYGMIRNAFKADFVYCRNMNVVGQMERDPRFRRLYPMSLRGADELTVYVYELIREPKVSYAMDYAVSYLPVTAKNFQELGPAQAEKGFVAKKLDYSGYLNLGLVFKEKLEDSKATALCAKVKPTAESVAKMAGSTYLALGGGRNIRFWKNGKPLYDSESAFRYAQMHQIVVPLAAPLNASDVLEFVVCSAPKANYWGFSLAGLTEREFGSVCAWKREHDRRGKDYFDFALGRIQQSCLGAIALPNLSSKLR